MILCLYVQFKQACCCQDTYQHVLFMSPYIDVIVRQCHICPKQNKYTIMSGGLCYMYTIWNKYTPARGALIIIPHLFRINKIYPMKNILALLQLFSFLTYIPTHRISCLSYSLYGVDYLIKDYSYPY